MAEQCGAGGDHDAAHFEVGAGRFVVTVGASHYVQQELVASAETAQARASDLSVQQPGAQVSWMPRPDLPGLVYFAGRYVAGIAGIRDVDRVIHVFALAPGVRVGADTALIALCREPIPSSLLEILPSDAGYPCWRCRVKVPGPDTPRVPKPCGLVLPMSGPLPEHNPRRFTNPGTEPSTNGDGTRPELYVRGIHTRHDRPALTEAFPNTDHNNPASGGLVGPTRRVATASASRGAPVVNRCVQDSRPKRGIRRGTCQPSTSMTTVIPFVLSVSSPPHFAALSHVLRVCRRSR